MKSLEIIRRMFANEESLSKQKLHALVKETVPVEQKPEGKFLQGFPQADLRLQGTLRCCCGSHQAEDQDGDIQPKVAKNTYQ